MDIFSIPYKRRKAAKPSENERELVKTLLHAADTAIRASAMSFPPVDIIAHVDCLLFVVCHLLPVYSQGVGASSTKPNDLGALVRPRRSVK
jgi:hypothetical protein